MSPERRAENWVRARLGDDHMNPRERAMRLLEEAAELAQAEGVDAAAAVRQINYVYGRAPGDPAQEAGAIAVCLLAWCASRGFVLLDLTNWELDRIEHQPPAEIRGSIERKADAGIVTCIPKPQENPPCR